jgi:putrescine aminotransferase
MGRTGKWWGCEHDGVAPDLMAIGKGFGGGVMPIGAVVGTPRTWQKYVENPFLHTTTFGGNPVACAAAIATIHVILEEDLVRQAAQKGEYLLGQLNGLAARHPRVMKLARGRGLMLGMEFADNDLGYKVATQLFARQILISGTYINARVLRVEPSLTIERAQLDRFLQALEESLQAVERTL